MCIRDSLDTVIKANNNGRFGLFNDSYILMGHSLGALIALIYEGDLPVDGFEKRCDLALKDLAITNLSKLLQCQLNEIPLPEKNNSKEANGIIGFNSFGSLIWPNEKDSGIKIPVLLIGGTFDLITPLISEQFKVFLSTTSNPLNRFLIIEGSSHFSPIRINDNYSENIQNNFFVSTLTRIKLNNKDAGYIVVSEQANDILNAVKERKAFIIRTVLACLLYTSPSPRDRG